MTKNARSEHTITRQELTDAVRAATSLQKNEAAMLVDEVIGEICNGLVRDGEVKLSNFGTFKVLSKAERMGRNPKTYKEHIIPAKRSVSFKAALGLKRKVNSGDDKTTD